MGHPDWNLRGGCSTVMMVVVLQVQLRTVINRGII